jgi:hypothetical protein
MKQAEILVVAPTSEFIVKANTKVGVVLAKVKWAGAFGPENQTMSTWRIGPIQLSDGKTNKAFTSDVEADAIEKEIDDYIGDCDAQINNFMQHKSTKSGDRKVIKYVDDFADDRAYEAGFYNQDLEDQVDKLFGGTPSMNESAELTGWVHLDHVQISKDAMTILAKAMRMPEPESLDVDPDTKAAIADIVDRITNALTNQDSMTTESWSALIYDAINAGIGDSRFDGMSEADIKAYSDSSVGADDNTPIPTFEGLFPERVDGSYETSPHNKVSTEFINAKQSSINDGTGFGIITCTDGQVKVAYTILNCMLKEINGDTGLGEHIVDEFTRGISIDKFKELAESALASDGFDLYEDDVREQYMSTHILHEAAAIKSFDAILEAIRFDEEKPEFKNDRTGTDYSKAFEVLHSNVVRVTKLAQGIYHHNNVDRDDQITIALVGNIETFLNKYMAEMEDVEKEFPNSYIPALTNNVTNIVNKWVKNISELDTTINQHFKVAGITGKQVIGMYNTEVYPEMSEVGNMITKMKFGLNHKDPNKATALVTKLANIIKHIDATQQKFHDTIMQRVHANKKWKQPSDTRQPSMA